jgi:hypothetical protein
MCREQTAQTTDRRALHLAEVLQLGMRGNVHALTAACSEER